MNFQLVLLNNHLVLGFLMKLLQIIDMEDYGYNNIFIQLL